MQISSAQTPVTGQRPINFQQQIEPAEGTTVHADNHENAGAPTPVEQAPESRAADDKPAQSKDSTVPEDSSQEGSKNYDPLTDPASAEYAQVKELQARDTEVRAHEQAHLSVAGKYATSGASYTFQTGPDGQQYAIGGEVGIDVSAVPDDPAATIAKMQVVQRAAMAPAEPSSQDIRVAAQAAQTASAARADLSRQQIEKMQGGGESSAAEEPKAEASAQPQTATALKAQDSYAQHQHGEEETEHKFQASA